jgi:alcohol dehydrogenase (NADP+)
MCAGASTFEALQAAETTSNDRVGVVGVGGLGHMAILFAKEMGCSVTAITSNKDNFDDAFGLGADECRLVDNVSQAWRAGQSDASDEPEPSNIDVLLITSNKVPAVAAYLPLLARRATIVLMTIQQESISIPCM